MRVVYNATFVADCPSDGKEIIYRVKLISSHIILVEDLHKCFSEIKKTPIYQEDVTALLAQRFNCAVETSGSHQRVSIFCEVK